MIDSMATFQLPRPTSAAGGRRRRRHGRWAQAEPEVGIFNGEFDAVARGRRRGRRRRRGHHAPTAPFLQGGGAEFVPDHVAVHGGCRHQRRPTVSRPVRATTAISHRAEQQPGGVRGAGHGGVERGPPRTVAAHRQGSWKDGTEDTSGTTEVCLGEGRVLRLCSDYSAPPHST